MTHIYHAIDVPPGAQARKQRGPYTLPDACVRAEHLRRAGVTTAAVRDDRALSAPDDRDGSEEDIKACYVTWDPAEMLAAAAVFATKPWLARHTRVRPRPRRGHARQGGSEMTTQLAARRRADRTCEWCDAPAIVVMEDGRASRCDVGGPSI